MIRMSSMPARTASSTTYWIAGLSTTGSISLGCAFVAGRNRVPSPAAGMTALVTSRWDMAYIVGWLPGVGRRYPWQSPHASASRSRAMPTYEYRCKQCGEDLEAVQGFHDDPLTECPACGGQLRKKFGSVGIAFKGSGFYKNDSRPSSGTKTSSTS